MGLVQFFDAANQIVGFYRVARSTRSLDIIDVTL